MNNKYTAANPNYTACGGATWATTGLKNAYLRGQYFDGTSSNMVNTSVRFSPNLTLEFWIRPDPIGSTNDYTLFNTSANTVASTNTSRKSMLAFGYKHTTKKLFLSLRETDTAFTGYDT
jgi:hypothetical protein